MTTLRKIKIPVVSGLSAALGSHKVNLLAEMLETEDREFAEKFTAHTGAELAWLMDEHETLLGLALRSCRQTVASLSDVKVNGIIAVTQSYEPRSPGLGYALHEALSLSRDAWVLEMNSACQGWVQALVHASQIMGGDILVVTADDLGSRARRLGADRNVRYIFSDAASSCLVSTTALSPRETIVASACVSSDRGALELAHDRMFMDGERVAYAAQKYAPEVLSQVADVGSTVFIHQANNKIIERIGKKARVDAYSAFSRIANCTSSSIPAALCEYYQTRDFEFKSRAVCGFGAGFDAWATKILLADKPRYA